MKVSRTMNAPFDPSLLLTEKFAVGQPVSRKEDPVLLRGEARFQVAKNPARPFVVATREARVRAVGTLFNVRTDGAVTDVAVLEGRVEVNGEIVPGHYYHKRLDEQG